MRRSFITDASCVLNNEAAEIRDKALLTLTSELLSLCCISGYLHELKELEV